VLNQTDMMIISWLRQMMHSYIPFTNDYIFGFPFGEFAFYCLTLYAAGELYLIKTGNFNKRKGAKK
jgi:hypothetical protein